MEFIRPFGEIGKHDAALAGGKGASLGEMTQAGIPVPPGYVLLSTAFDRFTEETDLNVQIDAILKTVNTEAMHTVEGASEKIQQLILAVEMPQDLKESIQAEFQKLGAEFVAVRSSATAEDSASAAWAGQLDTYLNTTSDTLLENVQRCWASLFTPRAIFYRFEKQLHLQKISVAVVVQKMVNSDAAGIAFSVHPVTEDRNQLIIEAGFGLGEAVVSGQITPDSYVVTKEPRAIVDKNVSQQERGLFRKGGGGNEWRDIPASEQEKQVLTDEQILALTETVCGIEKHYGFPVDTEWAMEKGEIYITQSRPITTLSESFNVAPSSSGGGASHLDVNNYIYQGRYTTSVFPSWFWFNRHSDVLDTLPEVQFIKKLRFLAVVGTHFFTEKAAWDQMGAFMRTRLTEDPTYFARITTLLDTETARALAWAKQTTEPSRDAMRELMEHGGRISTLWTLGYFASLVLDTLLEEKAKEAGFDPLQLGASIHPRETGVTKRQKDLLFLQGELQRKGISLDATAKEIAGHIRKDDSLSALFDRHLIDFGWISTINYLGDPLTLEKVIDEVIAVRPAEPPPSVSVPDSLAPYIEAVIDAMYLHQAGGEFFFTFNYETRKLLEKTAIELGVPYEEFLLLLPSEYVVAEPAELKKRIAERKEKGWCLYVNDANEMEVKTDAVLNKQILASLAIDPGNATSSLTGTIGNRGKATGAVRIVQSHDDFASFKKGEVLVTSMTTPDFVPLMQLAAAIVTDQGGLLSHAAIMSRELGKPCVIGTKIATQTLRNGDIVEVDAEAGIVRRTS